MLKNKQPNIIIKKRRRRGRTENRQTKHMVFRKRRSAQLYHIKIYHQSSFGQTLIFYNKEKE